MHRRSAQEALAADKARLRLARLGFPALVLGNVMLSFGPWMVRLADVGPLAAGFWRLTLAAPILVIALIATRQRLPGATLLPWIALIGAGTFFAADLGSWHAGILRTRLANATLFGNVTSFLLPIYGFIVARQLPRSAQALALLLAAAGTALLMGRSYELSPRNLAGDALCLAAGIFYTVYLILAGRAVGVSTLGRLTVMTLAGTLPLLLFADLLGERIIPHDWTPLILLALGSQIIGQGLMIFALGQVEPIVIGLTLLVQPIIASIIGWIGYGERLTMFDLVGAAMIAVALVIVRRPERAASTTP
jgi:drug/metabolite transporter (DMT)-like permease